MAKRYNKKALRSLIHEELEPRLLFSADLLPSLDSVAGHELVLTDDMAGELQTGRDTAAETEAVDQPGESLEPVIGNKSAADYKQLIADRQESADPAGTLVRTDWTGTLDTKQVTADYLVTPLAFEENTGQTDKAVDFLSRGSGYSVFLTDGDAVLVLGGSDSEYVVRLDLVGANTDLNVAGQDQLAGTSNYLIGNDESNWQTNVDNYSSVYYENVYEGIDLRYYGNQRQLEYDFVVDPGSNPDAIRLSFDGVLDTEITETGELRLILNEQGDDIYFKAPVSYQTGDDGSRTEVESGYVIHADGSIGFTLGQYDTSRELVIDPVLDYITLVGGTGYDTAAGIAADDSGNVYITGYCGSTDFPTTVGVYNESFTGGTFDFYVSKLSADGSTLIYSTFIGGTGNDIAQSIAVDASGNVYLAGSTTSSDLATVNSYQSSLSGAGDAFLLKLNSTGDTLLYASYFGGSEASFTDTAYDLALDASGNVYITGDTYSSDMPVKNSYDSILSGTRDAFVAKFDLSQSGDQSLLYSSFFGGTGVDYANTIAVDSTGAFVIAGYTDSTNLTTLNAYQAGSAGGVDAFVTRFNSSGSTITYSTYLGGTLTDWAEAVAIDNSGNIYVGGDTDGGTPTTPGAYDTTYNGSDDGFVSKIDPTLSGVASLVYSTYLGGSAFDYVIGIDVDDSGVAYVTGFANATFPTTVDGFDRVVTGSNDGFFATLSADGSSLTYSTFLGGDGQDRGLDVVWNAATGSAYVGGSSGGSTGWSGSPTIFGTTGDRDAFVAKFTFNQLPTATNNNYTVTEGGVLNGNVITDNTGAGVDSDPDSDPLTASLVDGALHGDLLLNANGSFTYTPYDEPASNFADTDTFIYMVSDGKGGTDTATVTITVTPNGTNEAPVNSVPGAQTTGQNVPLVFSAVNGNPILVRDDAGGNDIELTLSATNGTVTLAGTTGLAITGGADGSNTVTVQGSLTDINNGLNGLSFDPTPGYFGSGSLQVATDDLGQSGSGVPESDTDIINITVNEANYPPVITSNGDGIVTTPVGTGTDSGRSITVQPDGKILVAGTSDNDFALTRYNADGSLDTSFGGGDGKVTTDVLGGSDSGFSVAVQDDGKILVAGYIHNGTDYDLALTRYNANGSLDTGFGGGDGIVTTPVGASNDYGRSISIQPDGKILVAGYTDTGGTNYVFALTRYNTDGSLDTGFDGNGIVTTDVGTGSDYGYSITVQDDGKILVAGSSNSDFALTRYNTDGSLDTSFGGGDGILTTDIGTGSTDSGYSVTVQDDGKIVIGGTSNSDFALARYNTDGSLDTSFGGGDGKVTTPIGTGADYGLSVAVQADGKIVIGGYSFNGTDNDFALARYNVDGSLDTSFGGGDGKVTIDASEGGSDIGYSIVVLDDGRILMAGTSDSDFGLLSNNSDGSPDTTFGSGETAAINNDENTAGVTTVTATDPNPGDTLSYSISGGDDAALFTIDSVTGVLTFISQPDYENPTDADLNNDYQVTVQVDDGNGGIDTQDITVTVNQVSDIGKAVFSNNTNTPRTSAWNGSSFGVAADTATLPKRYRTIQGADAPTRDEKIVVGVDANSPGQVTGEMWNGSSWTQLPLSMGTVSENYWYGAEVAYEQLSGDAVVVWNDNSQAAGNKLRFAVWDGSSWTAPQSITAYTGAEPQNLRLAFDPGSDTMVLVVNDINADDYALVWDSDNWGNAITIDSSGTAESDQSAIAVAFEAQSGDSMVLYGKNSDSKVYYRIWDGSSWGDEASVTAAAGVTGEVAWLSAASDYTSDRIVLGVTTNSSEAWLSVWDGDTWETSEPAETGTTGTVYPNLAVAFESSTGNALATYGEGTQNAFRYRTWDAATGWSAEQIGLDIGDVPNSMTLDSGPTGDHIMLTVQDDSSDLHYLRWDGTGWSTDNELSTNTGEVKNQPFVFIYDQDGLLVDPNDAPVITLPGGAVNYTENSSPIIIDATATVTDTDSVDFDSGTLTVDFTANGTADDRLIIRHEGMGAGQINVSGTNVLYSGEVIGTGSGGMGTTPLVVTFNSAATPEAVQALVRNITFLTVTEDPSTFPRTVRFVVTDGDGGTSTAVTETINVTAINDAPTITNGATVILAGTDEDTTSSATTVDSILTSASWADVESGALKGIAVTGITGNGTWQYSTDGATWTAFGSVSSSSALLLISTTQIRYIPDGQNGETATFSFKAWDQTTGTASINGTPSYADPGTGGGTSAYSSQSAGASMTVTSVNDAPGMPGVPLGSTSEDVTKTWSVSWLAGFSWDSDTGALKGLAIVGADNSNGTWQYTLNGTDWFDVGAVAVDNALLLAADATSAFRFVPDPDWNGTTGMLQFKAWDQTSGSAGTYVDASVSGGTTAFSGTSGAPLTVNPVNDAPRLTTTGSALTYTENDPATIVDTALSVSDPDSVNLTTAIVRITGNFTVGQDLLAFTNQLGITGSYNSGSGILTLSGTTTVANYQAALRTVTYQNTSGNPNTATRTISFYADDGIESSAAATRNINIVAVNDAPIADDDFYSINEDTPLVEPADGVLLNDADLDGDTITAVFVDGPSHADSFTLNADGSFSYTPEANWNGTDSFTYKANDGTTDGNEATVTITVNPINDAPILLTGSVNNLTVDEDSGLTSLGLSGVTYGPGGGSDEASQSLSYSVTVIPDSNFFGKIYLGDGTTQVTTGNYTLAEIQGMQFAPNSDETGLSFFSFNVQDGGGTANGGSDTLGQSIMITVNPANDDPVIINLAGDELNYTEGDGAVLLEQGGDALVSDIDSSDFSGGSLNVECDGGLVETEDVFSIRNQGTDAGQIGVSGSNVTYEGTVIGSFTGGTGLDPLNIVFNFNATPAAVTALVQNITYENTNVSNPTTVARSLTIDITDGDGGASQTQNLTINVTTVNDAPVLDTAGTPTLSQINEGDINNNGDSVANIIASGGGDPITDVDSGAVEGIAITWADNSNGTWQYSTDDGANWFNIGNVSDTNALLLTDDADNRIRFVPAENFNGTVQFTYRAWDRTDNNPNATANVNVSVNGNATAYSSDFETATLTVQPIQIVLYFSTTGDVSASGAPGLDSWDNAETIGLGDPNVAFEPGASNGTLYRYFSLNNFNTGTTDPIIDAIHYVSKNVTIGGNGGPSIDLLAGDLLFAVNANNVELTGTDLVAITTDRKSLYLFRPDTPGDPSSGSFSIVLDNFSPGIVEGITLVEIDTWMGDTLLLAGTFLYNAGNSRDILHYTADAVGAGTTTGTTSTLISGVDIGLGNASTKISGLDLIEKSINFGNTSLTAGNILVTLDGHDNSVGNNGIDVTANDIFYLDVTTTTMGGTGTTSADAYMLVEGADLNLDTTEEEVTGLTLDITYGSGNEDPDISLPGSSITYTENEPCGHSRWGCNGL